MILNFSYSGQVYTILYRTKQNIYCLCLVKNVFSFKYSGTLGILRGFRIKVNPRRVYIYGGLENQLALSMRPSD
jgi:hypothetical protein